MLGTLTLTSIKSNLLCVQLAFGAAILNIQIPLMLGDLVNVVARFMREHAGHYVREIRGPALKLLGLYGIQVSAYQCDKRLHHITTLPHHNYFNKTLVSQYLMDEVYRTLAYANINEFLRKSIYLSNTVPGHVELYIFFFSSVMKSASLMCI